jgi:hypothetical protein
MEKKISKLGLWLVMVHSVIAIVLFSIDTMNAIQCGSSGFAILPLVIIDFPAFFISRPIAGFLYSLAPAVLDNTPSIILRDTIIHQSSIAIPVFILGGLQWYGIGWFISKLKQRFFSRSKVKEQFKPGGPNA